MGVIAVSMVGLSDDDFQRIRAFARKPRYDREPSELMSETTGEAEEEEQADERRSE